MAYEKQKGSGPGDFGSNMYNPSKDGHAEGTVQPSDKHGVNYNSPATHAGLSGTATSVNQKNPSGARGGDSGQSY